MSAVAIGESMARDFAAPAGEFHPILALPGRTPARRAIPSAGRAPPPATS